MKIKVFLLLFVLATAAVVALCDTKLVLENEKINQTKTERNNNDTGDKNQDARTVRKRGVLYNRSGTSPPYLINHWQKPYATHHSYGFHVQPSAIPLGETTALSKPNLSLLHYKRTLATLASSAPSQVQPEPVISAFPYAAPIPAVSSFVLKPGGAFVQSFSANYPQYYHQSHSPVLPVAAAPASIIPAAVPPVPAAVYPVHSTHQYVNSLNGFPSFTAVPHQLNPVHAFVQSAQPVHHHHIQPFQGNVNAIVPQALPVDGNSNAIIPSRILPVRPVLPPKIDYSTQRPLFTSLISDTSSFNGNLPGIGDHHHHHQPESGSSGSTPKITTTNGELPPTYSTTDSQQPWRPIFFNPPVTVNRPSNTLLPPFHGSTENTKPISNQDHQHRIPHTSSLSPEDQANIYNYFDNLSDDQIRQLLAQANFDSNVLKQTHKGYHY